MRTAIVNSFSLSPEQQEELNEILRVTGLTKSQLIQALLIQCKKNDLLVNLCVKELINKAGERWATSHNVGFDKNKRKPGEFTKPNSQKTYQNATTENNFWEGYDLEACIELAKTPWIEEYR